MVGMILDMNENDLDEFMDFRGFKSHIADFGQHSMILVWDGNLDYASRSKILNLG